MAKKVMICGGSGFLGSAVLNELITQGYETFNLGEHSPYFYTDTKQHYFKCNITDSENIFDIIVSTRPDIFINCCVRALGYSFTDPKYVHDTIIGGLINILEAIRVCHAHQDKIKFVQISSSEVYGTATEFPTNETHPMRPATLYAACKAAADMITLSYHRCYGMETVIVRPFNQVGINAPIHKNASVITKTFIRLLAGKNPIIMGNGFQTRDFMDTRDTAKGIIAAMNCNALIGHVVCLGSGKEVSINQLVQMCNEIHYNHVKKDAYEDFRIVHIDTRLGDNTRMRADISRAKQYLNWEPKISLYDSLHETYHWLEEKIKTNPEIIDLIEEP